MRRVIILLALLAMAVPTLGLAWADKIVPSFAEVVAQVSSRYPAVDNILSEDLRRIPAHNVVIVDVRRRSEWRVSHLEGAIHVPPGISPRALVKRLGPSIEGQTVIFYCSVGERSSRLADASANALKEVGVRAVYNLEGGIFGWHNEGLPLYRDSKITRDIHPYSDRWGRLVADASSVTRKAD